MEAQDGVRIFNHVPLLLCDVLRLNITRSEDNSSPLYAFDGLVPFRQCLLHARIVRRLKNYERYINYEIDDGTATIEMGVFKHSENMLAVQRLQNEVDIFEMHASAENKHEISNCLRALLRQTVNQLDVSNLSVGSKVLVYGRPNEFRNKVTIKAYSVCGDAGVRRDVEIAFKDYLIYWYTRKYPAMRKQLENLGSRIPRL